MGGAAGLEGAEVPGERLEPVSDGVSMDSRAFWRELTDALGLPAGGSDAYLGDLAPSEEGNEGSSSEEGSGFFGGGCDESESGDEEDPDLAGAAGVYRAQRAERATSSAQQPSMGAAAAAQCGACPAQRSAPAQSSSTANGRGGAGAAAAAGMGANGKGAGRTNGSKPHGTIGAGAGSGVHEERGDKQWESLTATDSDDESGNDAEFEAAYRHALERELAASRMGASFATAGGARSASPSKHAPDAHAHGTAPAADDPPPLQQRQRAGSEQRPTEAGSARSMPWRQQQLDQRK